MTSEQGKPGSIGGILLAAGSSRRFGGDKRLAILLDGRTLLQASIDNAARSLDTLLVVLRAGDTELKTSLEAIAAQKPNHTRIILAAHSEQGMAHSLADALAEVRDWQAAMVLLGDMPQIATATFQAMLAAYADLTRDDGGQPRVAPIIVPAHGGRQGHPVLFDRAYFGEMAALQGDRGARAVIDAHPEQVTLLEVDDPGILRDVDSPADLPH